MKLKELSPKAREAYGHSMIDAGMAIFKALILLVTVVPISVIFKSLTDNKDTQVTLVTAIERMSPGEYFMLMSFFFLSLTLGCIFRRRGLLHIHEAERRQ